MVQPDEEQEASPQGLLTPPRMSLMMTQSTGSAESAVAGLPGWCERWHAAHAPFVASVAGCGPRRRS